MIRENRQHNAILSNKRGTRFVLFFYLFFVVPNSLAAAPLAHSPQDSTDLYFYDIKFEGASVHINANYQYTLQAFVDFLKKNPSLSVHIRGHVCCRPGKRISRRRARNVYRYLKRSGISKSRLSYAGYSNTIPLIDPERSDEDERRNRRVDFIITYPDEKE
ncbi:MAG: OmpA family protein [Flavobacteriales bacterium]|nr:OmpA family protein [Flavobacteriales bacterium]